MSQEVRSLGADMMSEPLQVTGTIHAGQQSRSQAESTCLHLVFELFAGIATGTHALCSLGVDTAHIMLHVWEKEQWLQDIVTTNIINIPTQNVHV